MAVLTCINCPLGCQITVSADALGRQKIEGYGCKRGLEYAKVELTNPTRMVTSTVRLQNADIRQLPVKTSAPVPKAKIMDCMCALKAVEVSAPVRAGDIIVRNVCGTGSDIVATRCVAASESAHCKP